MITLITLHNVWDGCIMIHNHRVTDEELHYDVRIKFEELLGLRF